MKRIPRFPLLVLMACIVVAGCKKETQTQAELADELIITLPSGLVHIGAQWVDGKLWVESFDPNTNSCLLRQYDTEGKVVGGSIKVRLRACRMELPKKEDATQEAKTTSPMSKK